MEQAYQINDGIYDLKKDILDCIYNHELVKNKYVENDIDRDILTYLEENNNLPTLYENSNVFQKIRIKMRKFINRHFKRDKKRK